MNLNLATWQEFQLDHLFTIKKGKRLTSEEQEDGSNNYIGAIDSNNGVANHIAQPPIHPANTISVSYNGSVGEAFYQSEPYWATDDVNALYPRYPGFNSFIGLFIATVIRQEKYKFSYGRKWTLENMNKAKINLPALHNNNGTLFKDSCHTYSSAGYVPDWDFMEHYIKSLHYKPLTTSHSSSVTSTLSTADWKEFTLDAVFILKGGFYNKKPEHSSEGTIPFLASTESHNGVTEFYSLEDIESWDKVGNEDNTLDKKLYDGNCIAVTVNGSVCNAFYQRERFTCSHDITAFYLRSHEMTPHLAMFLCTIITNDKYRWSYGRKPHDVKKFGQSIIRLPVQHNSNGTILFDESHTYSSKGYIPDWAFMENYIKSLPYGDRL